jgi:hypothetical protein
MLLQPVCRTVQLPPTSPGKRRFDLLGLAFPWAESVGDVRIGTLAKATPHSFSEILGDPLPVSDRHENFSGVRIKVGGVGGVAVIEI